MATPVSSKTLRTQNRSFAGTGGVSRGNASWGFVPGFLDGETGCIYPSRTADGSPSPIHRLDGLPARLAVQRTAAGRVCAVKETVVAGFIRGGRFYTREELARASGPRPGGPAATVRAERQARAGRGRVGGRKGGPQLPFRPGPAPASRSAGRAGRSV
jgi:hypothetical protein